MAIHVEPDLAADVRAAITHEGITLQKKGEELFREYADACLHRAGNQLTANSASAPPAPYPPRRSSNDGDVVAGEAPVLKSVQPTLDDGEKKELPKSSELPAPKLG